MLVQAKAEYSCGGYPAPTYKGFVEVAMNISKNATDDQILNELSLRAQKQVARLMAFSDGMVRVIELTDIRQTLATYEAE